MKKSLLTLIFLVGLSFSVFADGQTPDGGRANCPPGQTCFTDPPADDGGENPAATPTDDDEPAIIPGDFLTDALIFLQIVF